MLLSLKRMINENKQTNKQTIKNKNKTTIQTNTATTYNSPRLYHRWRSYQAISLNDQHIGPPSPLTHCHHS